MWVLCPPYIFRPTTRFAYWTGILRWAWVIATTDAITPIMTTMMMAARNGFRVPTRSARIELMMSVGKRATIPMNMMSEMPFPIPRSVICSPSHMIRMVPAVWVIMVMRRKPIPGSGTTGTPWAPSPSRYRANANDCAAASRTVPTRVYCVIFFRPSSPSFCSFSKYGTTAPRSCMMIDTEM